MRHKQNAFAGYQKFQYRSKRCFQQLFSSPLFRFQSFESIMSYRLRKYMYIASIPTDLICATLRSDVSHWQR